MGCRSSKSNAITNGVIPSDKCSVKKNNGNLTLPKGEKADRITILHFNDVYQIEPREKEPVGGADRFVTQLRSYSHLNPLIFFSGDAFNPSMMSTVTKGKQMVPCLNEMNIHTAVMGNHDFDFGVEELECLIESTNFPWLLSNVRDVSTGIPLAHGEVFRVVEWLGRTIGIIGLVEIEWLVTLATISPEELDYRDFVTEGAKLEAMLRSEYNCELVIALTHMRQPNDEKLAREVPGIDLILGGHDHHYEIIKIGDTLVCKSGTDFRDLSKFEVIFNKGRKGVSFTDVEHMEITSDIIPDPFVNEIIGGFVNEFESSMMTPIGYTATQLEGRFSSIRTKETNLGNFICDIMIAYTHAQIAMLNSGTYRSDEIHDVGELRLKDLVRILPMPDGLVVLEITGEQLLEALENSVSQYPRLEGRFCQIAGMRFSFDPQQLPGKRVVEDSVHIGNRKIKLDQTYQLCTKAYLAQGKDGFDVFKDLNQLINEECGPVLPSIVRNHFTTLAIQNGFNMKRAFSVNTLAHTGSTHTGTGLPATKRVSVCLSDADPQHEFTAINPTVEGRIICTDDILVESF